MNDANHKPGRVCSRYRCNSSGSIDTPMGMMCGPHSDPLLFAVQLPYSRYARFEDFFLPWAFIAPHDAQAQANHGGQTLARLSERGGLGFDEVLAVLRDQPWRSVPFEEARAAVVELLREWEEDDERTVDAYIDEMAARRDPDVSLEVGRMHARVALSAGRIDEPPYLDLARIRREAIKAARERLERAAAESLEASSARYALRLLGEQP